MNVGGISCTSPMRLGSEENGRQRPHAYGSDHSWADQRRLRALIVEDELFVAMHLEAVLEDIGCEVSGILSNGESAVQQFHRYEPDVILMDINLGGGIDGITAAQRILAAANVPIIFVTAYSDAATRSRVESALPGSLILSKPVTAGGLRQAIQARKRH